MTKNNRGKKEYNRNDPGNYKWGLFYFNREDPRVFIPKRNPGFGWTLNFASPFSYIVIFAIIIVAVIFGKKGK
jgi:uncharacterized membrane protein